MIRARKKLGRHGQSEGPGCLQVESELQVGGGAAEKQTSIGYPDVSAPI